jgi:hypothetical protein
VGYRKLRPSFLAAPPAFTTHRATGDVIATILIVVGVMCVSYFEVEDDKVTHAVAGSALLAVLALKVMVVRRGGALGRLLPALGITVFLLLAVTWATSAATILT